MTMDSRDPALGPGWSGIVLVVVVVVTILGGMLLALADAQQGEVVAATTPEPTALPSATPLPEIEVIVPLPSPSPLPTQTPIPILSPSPLPTERPVETRSITSTLETFEPTPTATPSLTPPPPTPEPTLIPGMVERCVPPDGWVPYTVRRGDTLFSLSLGHGAGVEAIKIANCLSSEVIIPGDVIYLPTAPLPTPPPSHCSGPPLDWVLYTVQPGDTMFSLARSRGVTVYDVLSANCLESVYLYAGTPLYLPSAGPGLVPGVSPVPGTTPVPPPSVTREPGAVCSISSPAEGATVSGDVTFLGTAVADDFLFYKLEALGPGTGGTWASLLGQVVYTPVQQGVLGIASLTLWQPGAYTVRLVVVDKTSNEVAGCTLNLSFAAP
jgi:LysM repeat protein